ncbi:fibronectin type III-like domain-contianing protein, partial [Candidatus Sumerlaeota bacterium]|nr:fibronectin type III-like domain-contianing protein [Candidatus Sumerlaeota bacterium]
FEYSDLVIDNPAPTAGETIALSLNLQNTGKREGEEVVQVYVRDDWSPEPRPLKRLKGFERVHLAAGENRPVRIPLLIDSLAYYDEARSEFRVLPGEYEIQVGASSVDIRLSGTIRVHGEDGGCRS